MKKTLKKKHPVIKSHAKGLHIVAFFEGVKGLVVLLAGFGLLSFIHKDIYEEAMHLVKFIHLNPASQYPRIFLDLMENVTDARLWSMAFAAIMYSLVRFVEATGLWYRKIWAEWFAVLSGGIYIPVEIYEVIRRQSWPSITVLAVNVGIVVYLLLIMFSKGGKVEK